jgi:hypothetical protein
MPPVDPPLPPAQPRVTAPTQNSKKGIFAVAQVIDKAASGLVGTDAGTWKNAAMVAAGAIDPDCPALISPRKARASSPAYLRALLRAIFPPNNVQNTLLAGSSVAGGASAANMPASGTALRAGPPIVRGTARATNAVLNKAPEYVLGGTGAAIGGAFGGGTGAGIGGTIGAIAGRTLPKFKIPGDNFGAPQPQAPTVYPGAPYPKIREHFPVLHILKRHLRRFYGVTHWREVLSQGNPYRERLWARFQARKRNPHPRLRTCKRNPCNPSRQLPPRGPRH